MTDLRFRPLPPITGADGVTWAEVACLSAPIPHLFPRVVDASKLTEV